MNKINISVSILLIAMLVLIPIVSAEETQRKPQFRNVGGNENPGVPTETGIVDLGNGYLRYDHVHKLVGSEDLSNGDPQGGITRLLYKTFPGDPTWADAAAFHVDYDESGLNEDWVKSIIETSHNEWNKCVANGIFDVVLVMDPNINHEFDISDGKNTVTFEDFGVGGTIACAQTWFHPSTGVITESDVVFNTHYTWGENDNPNAEIMDLQNIATHEFGHSAGLGDLYPKQLLVMEQTMYGRSGYGDIQKRSIECGDIAGIQSLYGNPALP